MEEWNRDLTWNERNIKRGKMANSQAICEVESGVLQII